MTTLFFFWNILGWKYGKYGGVVIDYQVDKIIAIIPFLTPQRKGNMKLLQSTSHANVQESSQYNCNLCFQSCQCEELRLKSSFVSNMRTDFL